jgi:TolB-like protein
MADVFLSYKREDAAKVRKLVAALRDAGLSAWWDEDIPGGAQWEASIEKALNEAKAVIVCWSPASVNSENVRSEARVARDDGRLIQLFLKPCTPPLFFGERQGIDLIKWRGDPSDESIAKVADSVRRMAAGERIDLGKRPNLRRWLDYRIHVALAALVVLVGSFAGWWLLAESKAEGPMTVAVLPFRALNPTDANLVDAIWDDTRGAIGRNPNLRVLGREAVTALAKLDLQPADYRKKVGADYLLDGSVEHVADQVRMKISLTRTKDGTEVWSDQVGGKLDDVFAFQQRIASEVEGRIRGRIAPGGGIKDRNIATTGEVYSIYADARAQLRKRDPASSQAAIALLRKALVTDPNYAPAWASLGQVTGMGFRLSPDEAMDQREARAVSYLQRALQLAPNLARAHAALAMVQSSPPELEGELLKAVELDPSDAEAWTWLGGFYAAQNRLKESLAAQSRAVEIEPLWYTAVFNKMGALSLLGDSKGMDQELRRVAAAGDPVILAKLQAMAAGLRGQPGERVRILLQLRAAHPEEASFVDARTGAPLLQLGFIEEGVAAWHMPAEMAAIFRGVPPPPKFLQAHYHRPADFWLDDTSPAIYGRSLAKHGRLSEYIGYYREAFKSADDVALLFNHYPARLILTVPTLVVNLRAAGENVEANELLQKGEAILLTLLHNGPPTPDLLAKLAPYRALEGRDGEAVTLLSRAVDAGLLPDGAYGAIDIADEPCFARLANRSDFQAVRQRILVRISEERRKVPLALLAQAYPTKNRRAA